MSCYHPFVGYPDFDSGLTQNNAIRYKLGGSFHPEMKLSDPWSIKIPCGHCLGCRLDQARSWADRMILEFDASDQRAFFLTLTYNNDCVPLGVTDYGEPVAYSLCKRDLQLFFKSFRKRISPLKIRYYASGEYGSRTKRPHYHAIIFGLDLEYFTDRFIVGKNELGDFWYSSPSLEEIWSNGFISIAPVSYKTCSYVARYCMKKVFDSDMPDCCEPEFAVMSRRPGLGYPYYQEHGFEIFESDHIFLGGSEPQSISIPSYFKNKLKVDNPKLYGMINSDRSKLLNDRELLQLQRTSLSYIDLLELEENSKFNKTKILFNREEVPLNETRDE